MFPIHRAPALVRLVVSLLLALPSASANALLLEVDLGAPGDARVTRDTETGLDWLDLELTVGRSVDEIERGVGGWVADGWRHANANEVCGLLSTFGFAPAPCPGPVTIQGEPEALEEGLFAYLGITSVLFFPSGQAIASFEDGGNPARFGELNSWLITDSSAHIRAVADVTGRLARDPRRAHFLVRTVVPEPSTGLLVLSGLATIGAAAARSRRS